MAWVRSFPRAIDSPNDRRRNGKRSLGRAKFDTEIVLSAKPVLVAPDIASIFEGKLCDMDAKSGPEFCLEGGSAADGEGESCFHLNTLALMKRRKIVDRGAKSNQNVKRCC